MTGERGHPHFKRALLRVIRCALVVGEAFYRGRRITASRLAAVAPAEKISAVHEKLGQLSKGHQHLEWLQEQKGRPAEARASARPPPGRRKRPEFIRVIGFNCESCAVVGRLDELLRWAGSKGAAIMCLQGTCLTLDTDWKSLEGQWKVIPTAKTSNMAGDGCAIAINLALIPESAIAASHVWEQGRAQGVS